MDPLTPSHDTIPVPALVLGVAGLIPFAVPAAIILWGPGEWRSFGWVALLAYGAVILSFVGAVHWGLALRQTGAGRADSAGLWRTLGWSVTPALLAWLALMLPPGAAVLLLLGGFGAQYWADERAFRAQRIPLWYLRLRRLLTAGVMACLGLALTTTF